METSTLCALVLKSAERSDIAWGGAIKDSDLYPPGAVSCRTSCCLGAEGGDRVVRKDPEQDMLQLGVRVEAEKD